MKMNENLKKNEEKSRKNYKPRGGVKVQSIYPALIGPFKFMPNCSNMRSCSLHPLHLHFCIERIELFFFLCGGFTRVCALLIDL